VIFFFLKLGCFSLIFQFYVCVSPQDLHMVLSQTPGISRTLSQGRTRLYLTMQTRFHITLPASTADAIQQFQRLGVEDDDDELPVIVDAEEVERVLGASPD
jgi:hypothetical protein